jgi:type IV secretion system protein VirB11
MSDASYLDVYLSPFLDYLRRTDVTDLFVNRPGEMWVETLGGGIERVENAEITEAQLWRLARQVASVTHQGISREHPLLSARLPDGSRVQIVAPPATRTGMVLAVRKHVSSNRSLSDYEEEGAFNATKRGEEKAESDAELELHYANKSWINFLRTAVKSRKTIIVSGGTSTGKTTFLNALMQEIGNSERLIMIEDTPELSFSHSNAIGLVAARGVMGEANVSTDDLLIASLRLRPDRILLGELRGQEAFTFLRAINTGHPGSMTTIHADSPEGAIEQLILIVLQSGVSLQRMDLAEYMKSAIDIVVQLERRMGARSVSSIMWNR